MKRAPTCVNTTDTGIVNFQQGSRKKKKKSAIETDLVLQLILHDLSTEFDRFFFQAQK
jgi:hypothetical protein